jgi:type I restriction enzyme S subunit
MLANVAVSTVDKKQYEGQIPVRLCNYTDVYYNDFITAEIDFMEATATPDQIERFAVRAGDVVITKDSETSVDIGRPAFVPNSLPGVIYGYHLAVYRPLDHRYGRFLKYVFDSASTRAELARRTPGVTRVGLSQDTLRNLRISAPSPDEARQIADYLDHETAEIDAFIAELEEARRFLVERLASQLWSLTSPRHGIDGVEQPLGTLASFVAGGTPDSNNLDYWSDDGTGVPWVAIGDMSRRERVRQTSKHVTSSGMAAAGLRLLAPGTILLAMYASVGEVAKLEISAVTNQAILGIAPGRDLNGDYLMAHLRSRQALLVAEARSNTQANLNAHQVRHLKLWRPNRAVQDRIADEITVKQARHRAQFADIDAATALAKERRVALITAAVTGHIDVTTKQFPAVDSIRTAIQEAR